MRKAKSVRQPRPSTSELRRLWAVVLALAVLFSTVLAGQKYFYCAPMDAIAFDTCCAGEQGHEHDADDTDLAVREVPGRCCDTRMFDAGDRGFFPTFALVLDAPVVGWLSALDAFASDVHLSGAPRRTQETRAGPPRAGPLGWRTTTDVSLT